MRANLDDISISCCSKKLWNYVWFYFELKFLLYFLIKVRIYAIIKNVIQAISLLKSIIIDDTYNKKIRSFFVSLLESGML